MTSLAESLNFLQGEDGNSVKMRFNQVWEKRSRFSVLYNFTIVIFSAG